MCLRERGEQGVTAQAYAQWEVNEVEREEEPGKGAIDGDYLLPVTLFETNKNLFDLGMMHFFAVSS